MSRLRFQQLWRTTWWKAHHVGDNHHRRSQCAAAAAICVFRALKPRSAAAGRILDEVNQAERRLKSTGLTGIGQFGKHLRAINMTGVRQTVQAALADYATAVENSAKARRTGGDLKASDDAVAAAKRTFVEEASLHRGQRHHVHSLVQFRCDFAEEADGKTRDIYQSARANTARSW